MCAIVWKRKELDITFLVAARMLERVSIFGSYLLELFKLCEVKPVTLIHFVRRTTNREVSLTCSYIMELFGPKCNGLSTKPLTLVCLAVVKARSIHSC